jgi:hypothetical protein
MTDPVTTPLRGDNSDNTTNNSAISSARVLLLVLL